MKSLFFIFCLIVICEESSSQQKNKINIEQVLSIGSSIATGLPAGVDNDGGLNLQVGFLLNMPLKKFKVETGLSYQWTKYSMDGFFLKENSTSVFKTTPANYKQHSLMMERVNLPLKIKKYLDDKVSIGLGIVNSYYTYSKSKFKIADDKYEVKGVIFRRFQVSPVFDTDIKIPLSRKYVIVGLSTEYQVTSFIADQSFKPLIFELRFQNPFF